MFEEAARERPRAGIEGLEGVAALEDWRTYHNTSSSLSTSHGIHPASDPRISGGFTGAGLWDCTCP